MCDSKTNAACQANVTGKCTGKADVSLADGSPACEECERALLRESHDIDLRTRKAPLKTVNDMPRTTPFGRLD